MEHEPPDRPTDDPAGGSTTPRTSHTLAAPALRFNVRNEAEQLKRLPTYQNGSPAGRTLVKEPDLRIVLLALMAGARLEEHRASGPISVQVLEGRVRLRLTDGAIDLAPGELLTLEPGISHDVDSVEDAVILLTIGRTTYQHVSDRHEPHT